MTIKMLATYLPSMAAKRAFLAQPVAKQLSPEEESELEEEKHARIKREIAAAAEKQRKAREQASKI